MHRCLGHLADSERSYLEHGAVAQLGERLPCTQEVRSSILLGSTISNQHLLFPAPDPGAFGCTHHIRRAHIRCVGSESWHQHFRCELELA